VELIRALWTEDKVTYRGQIYQIDNVKLATRSMRKPHPPLWMGVGHPDAVRRAATLADGWMGSGGSSIAEFKTSVPILKQALEAASHDPSKFPISKRVFMAVDERPAVARAELNRWFTEVYHNPPGTDASGIHGTPEQVRERLEDLVAAGANHLLLNRSPATLSNWRQWPSSPASNSHSLDALHACWSRRAPEAAQLRRLS
jgi:alkanesulfonate monooxygenase SsuD/methylene tetrahydromethanopterin reductase-like flavin-dependent oxidoreductase (luciferase family)